MTDLIFCEAKPRVPSERAAAKVLDVDVLGVEVWLLPIWVGEAFPARLLACPVLGAWRRNCRAFASAFSCVRTNCARFW